MSNSSENRRISEVVLSMDCLEALFSSLDFKGWRILEKAGRKGIRIWVHLGILNALFERWLSKGRGLEFKRLVGRILEYAKPLAALSEDAFSICNDSVDPYVRQVLLSLDRLGPEAKALCVEHLEKPASSGLWITIDEFTEYLDGTVTTVPVPFVDLRSQQDRIRASLEKNIFRVLMHGRYVRGDEVSELEHKLAEYVGVRHCIACSSGTDAILLSLLALRIGPGDAVFTSPFTFFATAEAIALLGATPVFVDVDPVNFLIDPNQLVKAVKSLSEGGIDYPLPESGDLKARAVITVDLFGVPCDYDRIRVIADRYGLLLIEDAAQAFGARRKGRRACSFGDLACTSFFPAKPLGCYGDGGAVFTDFDEYADVVRSLRDHGQGLGAYEHLRVGLNARMDTLQAAILLAKLEIFEEELGLRRKVAEEYSRLIGNLPGVRIPQVALPELTESAWAQYCVVFERKEVRDKVRRALNSAGIPCAVYYPVPLHLQPAFSRLGYKKGDFPVAEWLSERVLALPFHPYLGPEVMEKVAGIIEASIRHIS
ncbi:dTDP-4-amino-4,6-dideoxygalactose transaminase [Thermodesulforhabdus norvegica]|uniref:dTDP-4-amino-4,6-dideoxygalactose transaminase n=2 Tax=Thermodesulforhabdus norvegica TaxID=39841 RepID=A0A1I4RG25_9BACT|nr:dTDP-4-amino-4,6-dideoxygalactose transaminase [Thermodesulforhabdus norvegica]